MREPDQSSPRPLRSRSTRRRPGGRSPSTPFESRIRKGASLDALDLAAAAEFLGVRPADAEDALRELELIRGKRDECQVTNAALLLFARHPARQWHPSAGIRVMRVEGTARIMGQRDSATSRAYAGPPLPQVIRKSLALVPEYVRPSEPLRHIFFAGYPEYPAGAWREVLINAVLHRDYEAAGETEIIFYDDRLEVSSPGAPMSPVSLDELRRGGDPPSLRNPLIGRALARAGLVSTKAKGLLAAADEMANTLLPEPRMENRSGFFTVTLSNQPEFDTAGPGWKRLVSRLGVDPDQKRILLARPDGFTVDDYARLNSVPARDAQRRVDDLADRGIVAPLSETGGAPPEYFLTADLDSRRCFLEHRLPALREHLRGRASLRNADYRGLFQVSYPKARKELDLLVADGFLRPMGRGRALRYLATVGLRKPGGSLRRTSPAADANPGPRGPQGASWTG